MTISEFIRPEGTAIERYMLENYVERIKKRARGNQGILVTIYKRF